MSRCVITCAEVGCRNKIAYDPKKDAHVPLYCHVHRTTTGRHAACRVLQPEKPIDTPEPIIIMRCPKCKLRREVSERTWKSDVPVICECGHTMLYHRTKGDEHVIGGAP